MEAVFIDTSIFVANNFFESARIQQFLTLGELGKIQLILPRVTVNEIKDRGIKNIKSALLATKDFRDKTKMLNNIPNAKINFEKIDEEECINEFTKLVDEIIQKAKVIIVEYPKVDIGLVFEKYFKNDFPFSQGNKKHEFPDAFALLSVELWCQENNRQCFVFSNDKDLLSYRSRELIIYPKYTVYLDKKLRKIEIENKRKKILDIALERYKNQKHLLEKELEEWVKNELENISFYDSDMMQKIDKIEIDELNTNLQDFLIMSINDHEVTVETQLEIYLKVEVQSNDDDSGFYDNLDKEWKYSNSNIEIIEKKYLIPVQLKLPISLAGEQFMDIKLDTINHGRSLRII